MDLEILMQTLANKYPWLLLVLSLIGTIVVFATAIIKITPSKKDDEILEGLLGKPLIQKILEVLEKFSLIKLK